MPDGGCAPDDRLDRCARAMKDVTRRWAALEASGPRDGPVREAITELEPVFHTQMMLALAAWTGEAQSNDGPATERLRLLVDHVLSPSSEPIHAIGGPQPGLTAIEFVQLWPAVLKEVRDARA